MKMRIRILTLFLFQLCHLQASLLIVDPVFKSVAGFHYLSGPNEENQIEDIFLRKGTILRVSIEPSSWREDDTERTVWIAQIITEELSSEFWSGSGPERTGVGGATENRQFDLVFKSRKNALSVVTRLLVAEKPAEQAGTGQPATRAESKSEGGDKPQPEAEGRSR